MSITGALTGKILISSADRTRPSRYLSARIQALLKCEFEYLPSTPAPTGNLLIIGDYPSAATPTSTGFEVGGSNPSPTATSTSNPTGVEAGGSNPIPTAISAPSPTTGGITPPTRPAVWKQVGNSVEGTDGQQMGTAVAISNDGKTIAMSGGIAIGKTKFYELQSESWVTRITHNGGETVKSVSISSSGYRIVCGNTSYMDFMGQAVVFSKINGQWTQDNNTGEMHGSKRLDKFGYSVSISEGGNILAVGTNGGDYVQIFREIDERWRSLNKFEGPSAIGFGKAISMSQNGNMLLVGAPNSSEKGDNTGNAHFYNLSSYSLIQSLQGPSSNSYLGTSVSMSKNGFRAAVGAYGQSLVRLFRYSGGQYILISAIKNDSRFGISVSISGDGKRLAVGATYATVSGKTNVGRVHIFDVNDNGVNQIEIINGISRYDQSGSAVALSENGEELIIGAHLNDQGGLNAGYARVFKESFL